VRSGAEFVETLALIRTFSPGEKAGMRAVLKAFSDAMEKRG